MRNVCFQVSMLQLGKWHGSQLSPRMYLSFWFYKCKSSDHRRSRRRFCRTLMTKWPAAVIRHPLPEQRPATPRAPRATRTTSCAKLSGSGHAWFWALCHALRQWNVFYVLTPLTSAVFIVFMDAKWCNFIFHEFLVIFQRPVRQLLTNSI